MCLLDYFFSFFARNVLVGPDTSCPCIIVLHLLTFFLVFLLVFVVFTILPEIIWKSTKTYIFSVHLSGWQ